MKAVFKPGPDVHKDAQPTAALPTSQTCNTTCSSSFRSFFLTMPYNLSCLLTAAGITTPVVVTVTCTNLTAVPQGQSFFVGLNINVTDKLNCDGGEGTTSVTAATAPLVEVTDVRMPSVCAADGDVTVNFTVVTGVPLVNWTITPLHVRRTSGTGNVDCNENPTITLETPGMRPGSGRHVTLAQPLPACRPRVL